MSSSVMGGTSSEVVVVVVLGVVVECSAETAGAAALGTTNASTAFALNDVKSSREETITFMMELFRCV
jgi:hypothetical protein